MTNRFRRIADAPPRPVLSGAERSSHVHAPPPLYPGGDAGITGIPEDLDLRDMAILQWQRD
jgi:hypothetical protein